MNVAGLCAEVGRGYMAYPSSRSPCSITGSPSDLASVCIGTSLCATVLLGNLRRLLRCHIGAFSTGSVGEFWWGPGSGLPRENLLIRGGACWSFLLVICFKKDQRVCSAQTQYPAILCWGQEDTRLPPYWKSRRRVCQLGWLCSALPLTPGSFPGVDQVRSEGSGGVTGLLPESRLPPPPGDYQDALATKR
ncbi:Hypothetical predicted protein [Pelobates cultripes]|uniref:Uncharacterized protein n=1 Tax=Pelobates cultripes TaxID=61616 RepID=A0AAD1VV98_PELCU|nr:Hypothetical predicted protein [Pelobates cultripes]